MGIITLLVSLPFTLVGMTGLDTSGALTWVLDTFMGIARFFRWGF